MRRLAVLDVVGLTDGLIQKGLPQIAEFRRKHFSANIEPALPAVTCTAQSNYVTGTEPRSHGAVGNGWYHRELAEVHFWKQSNHIVQGRKIWDELRSLNSGFTCAKLFWWYNMYARVDYSITPRPMYPADGRKIFDIYTWPYEIRPAIKHDLGEFPFPAFWGPGAGSSRPFAPDAVSKWIAASAKWIEEKYRPTLSLIYLPHLDYNLQRFGNSDARIQDDLSRVDTIVGDLIQFFRSKDVQVLVLSEYGITDVAHPIHLNRVLREQGWLTLKEELGRELIDFGASRAFAVADHQVAHVYVQDEVLLGKVREVLRKVPHVTHVLDRKEQAAFGLDHERSGDLVAVSDEASWFTYYYWEDEARAPDFARCVDIHRKPGYDPVELFIDPAIAVPQLKIAWRLLQKKMGMRMLMDVIPLQAELVKGSHGCRPAKRRDYPIIISQTPLSKSGEVIRSTDVYGVIRDLVMGS